MRILTHNLLDKKKREKKETLDNKLELKLI